MPSRPVRLLEAKTKKSFQRRQIEWQLQSALRSKRVDEGGIHFKKLFDFSDFAFV
jgi:hypothetical protein